MTVRAALADAWRAAGASDPETGWFGTLAGSVAIAVLLLLHGPDLPVVWAAYLVAALAWAGYAALGRRASGWTAGGLGVGAVLAAAAAGPSLDSTGLAVACVLLGMLAAQPAAPAPASLAAVVLAGAAYAAGGHPLDRLLMAFAVLAVVTLSGLLRRQYALRIRQTAAMLAQTRAAQAEHARAAALDERARIARELHDVLAHSLGALGVQLEVAEALLAEHGDPERAVERVRGARRLAAEGLVEARDAVAALRHDVPSLADAVRALAAAYRRDHGGEVTVAVRGAELNLPPAVAVAMQRVARESLTNAAKHAPGAPLQVTLDVRAEALRLEVLDGGVTMQEAADTAVAGFGLAGMRERLELVGGRLAAGPDGGGWRVVAEVPLR